MTITKGWGICAGCQGRFGDPSKHIYRTAHKPCLFNFYFNIKWYENFRLMMTAMVYNFDYNMCTYRHAFELCTKNLLLTVNNDNVINNQVKLFWNFFFWDFSEFLSRFYTCYIYTFFLNHVRSFFVFSGFSSIQFFLSNWKNKDSKLTVGWMQYKWVQIEKEAIISLTYICIYLKQVGVSRY